MHFNSGYNPARYTICRLRLQFILHLSNIMEKKQIVNFELIFLCFCLQETVAFLAVREINSYCPRSYVRTVSTLDMSGVALTTDYHKRY